MPVRPTDFDLIPRIQRVFADGPPNGWLLGWDENRGFVELKRVAYPWLVENCTSFDYAFCNWFDIACRIDSDSNEYILGVFTSFIADYYQLFWTRLDRGRKRAEVVPEVVEMSGVHAAVVEWLHRRGFSSVPPEFDGRIVPGVELELSEPDEVTVDKCLFRDH